MKEIQLKIIWQEYKFLDKSTNFSSRIEIIKEFKKLGVNVKYYSAYKYKKQYYGLDKSSIHYFVLPRIEKIRRLFFLFTLFIFNIRLVLVLKPDIVLLDYITLLVAWPSVLLNRILSNKTRYVLDIRTFPVNREKFKIEYRIFKISLKIASKLCDGISLISPYMKKSLLKIVKLGNLPTVIWSSGFNELIFKPLEYPRSKNDFILFYHGGLSISRGIIELMKATKLLRKEGLPIRLKLVGNIVEREKLYGFIKKNAMEDYCTISERVDIDRIPILISECDLPVIPLSNFIGWRVSSPLKLMEYLAMGKCVVVTDIEAHRDVVQTMPFAFYSKSEKAEDLKNAILRAYENRHYFEKWGKLARKFALENYTWKIQAKYLMNFLGKIDNE